MQYIPLINFKDNLDKKLCSYGIYRHKCSNCNVTYYGKTYRYFLIRAAERKILKSLLFQFT